MKNDWLTRADRVGFDIDACFDRVTRPLAVERLGAEHERLLFDDLVNPNIGLCAESNTFTRSDVFKAIADWSIADVDADGNPIRRKVLVPPAEIQRLTAEFCATTLVAEVGNAGAVIRRRDGTSVADGQAEPAFTTIELLDTQQHLVELIAAGIATGAGTVTPEHLDVALACDARLTVEQRELVTSWLTSGDRVQAAVGRAGTGKTTTMRAAAAGWSAAGYRVIGAAVKGEAALQLATDAGIAADTIAMHLARHAAGTRVFDARTILIVDEASTVGDRDLRNLLAAAIDAGTTVRLIGDTAQHGSVPAGGSYADLVARYPDRTPELTEVRRLTDPGERARADLLRSGNVTAALDQLVASGQLTLTNSDADTYAHLVTRWAHERSAGRAHPMVHGRNIERRLLNTLAQHVRIDAGEVDPEHGTVTLRDGRRLCVGDEVIARHGDRNIFPVGNRDGWMRNGTTGTVIAVHQHGDEPDRTDRIDINTAGGVISLPRTVFDRPGRGGIDLAYAVTSYAVQGSTTDVSTSAVTATTGRAELYVDITRGRHSNQLYATRTDHGRTDTEPHLPTLPIAVVDSLAAHMARDVEPTALTRSPDAARVEQRRHGRSLAGLNAARRRNGGNPDPTLDAAITRATRAVHRVGINQPDPTLVSRLPRPTVPHLALRWDQLAGDIAVHHATVGLPSDTAGGIAADDPDADEIAARLAALAVDVTLRQLSDHVDPTTATAGIIRMRPGWLTHHLEQRFATTGLAGIDLDQLAAVVHDVHAWRVDHDLIDNTADDQPLGPTPDNDIERAQHRSLTRRLNPRARPRGGSRSIA